MQYRITQEKDFGSSGLWYAEEKTSFGWEKVDHTMAATAQEANELLEKERPHASTGI